MTSPGKITADLLAPELHFTMSRSGGPGGQNVNKVNTKVTLRFDVRNSNILDESEKELILKKLASRITADGVLMVAAQEKRSQGQNKEEALAKFDVLLVKAFAKKKVRKPTKPSKAAKLRRIESKKRTSEKKQWRSQVR